MADLRLSLIQLETLTFVGIWIQPKLDFTLKFLTHFNLCSTNSLLINFSSSSLKEQKFLKLNFQSFLKAF